MKYLLDTNIVIGYLRGKQAVVSLVNSLLLKGLGVSCATLAELYHGAEKSAKPKQNKKNIDLLLSLTEVQGLAINQMVAKEYALIITGLERKGVKLGSMDLLIAATAKANKLIILTEDKKHFPRLKQLGVKVEVVL